MRYQFLVETYRTEREKVLSVWSSFHDGDLPIRPHPTDPRGRSVLEHMVHQCVSEELWFRTILGLDAGLPALPSEETQQGFLRQYAAASEARVALLQREEDPWWEASVTFFDVPRSRAWVVVRRIAHTAHHRGQQTTLLRQCARALHSTYGPTADTGGLMVHRAPTIYPYDGVDQLLAGASPRPLPGPGSHPPTERPQGG